MDKYEITKTYTNGEVSVVWNSGLCTHSAQCVKNLPKLFSPSRRPWIMLEEGTSDDILTTVSKCPSGALPIKVYF